MPSPNPIIRIIKLNFGVLPVVDAISAIRLQPMPQDVAGAVQKDPRKCVFARCATRMFGASKVVFYKSSAYIDLVGEDGIRRVERFYVSDKIHREIVKFDRGEPLKMGTAFILRPFKSNGKSTLKAKRKYIKQYTKTPAGRTVLKVSNARMSVRTKEAQLEQAQVGLARARETYKPDSPRLQDAVKQEQVARQSLATAKARFDTNYKEAKELGHKPKASTSATPLDLSLRNGRGKYTFSVEQAG